MRVQQIGTRGLIGVKETNNRVATFSLVKFLNNSNNTVNSIVSFIFSSMKLQPYHGTQDCIALPDVLFCP